MLTTLNNKHTIISVSDEHKITFFFLLNTMILSCNRNKLIDFICDKCDQNVVSIEYQNTD